ncbi:inorganic phosphate transporter, partial [Geobacillus sp. NFOSA3]|nr:inorganic phosphate transporter [Geobacillus sp. NFOSA3]
MDYILVTTILIVIASLLFDFINGFHDTANAIATSVSTKALKPRQAIFLAAIMNFLG